MNGDFRRKQLSAFPIATLCPEATGRHAGASILEATGKSTKAGHLFVHVSSDPADDSQPLTYEQMDLQQQTAEKGRNAEGSTESNTSAKLVWFLIEKTENENF